jgi:hypothetical protein
MIELGKLTNKALGWCLQALLQKEHERGHFSLALLSSLTDEELRRLRLARGCESGDMAEAVCFTVPLMIGEELIQAHAAMFLSAFFYRRLAQTGKPDDQTDLESACDFCGSILDRLGEQGRRLAAADAGRVN